MNAKSKYFLYGIAIIIVLITISVMTSEIVLAVSQYLRVPQSSLSDKQYHSIRDARERSDAQLKELNDAVDRAVTTRDKAKAMNDELRVNERMSACMLVFSLLNDHEQGIKKINGDKELSRLNSRREECMGFTSPEK